MSSLRIDLLTMRVSRIDTAHNYIFWIYRSIIMGTFSKLTRFLLAPKHTTNQLVNAIVVRPRK
jgi:hypothetical protein